MPLQNRVTPDGNIIATSARGTFMGNRGIIHDPANKRLKTRRWQHKAWICCVLQYKDWQHPIMGVSAYTELFFLDEVTALAAGHRPCALCRRPAFKAFKQCFAIHHGISDVTQFKAKQMDSQLHKERVAPSREKVTYHAPVHALPDGVFVRYQLNICLLSAQRLWPWTANGYGAPLPLPPRLNEVLEVLTPATIVAILANGYKPAIHCSVDRQAPSTRLA